MRRIKEKYQSAMDTNWKIVSGSGLKILALLSMIVDHVGGWILTDYSWAWETLYAIGDLQITWMFYEEMAFCRSIMGTDDDVQWEKRIHPWKLWQVPFLRHLSPAHARHLGRKDFLVVSFHTSPKKNYKEFVYIKNFY